MTKYEEELSKRIGKVGDKFIYRGSVYNTIEGDCRKCDFANEDCGYLPVCHIKEVIYIKEILD